MTGTRWADAAGSAIIAEIDGKEVTIPADPNNRHFAAAVASPESIAPYVPPPPSPPTADDVRAEASRRMQALVGARDAEHLSVIVSNGTREAVKLLRIRAERAWTAAEAERAAQLESFETAFDAIRAASNAMEPNPPADFAEDSRWPATGAA